MSTERLSRADLRRSLAERLARPMATIALLFLVLVGAAIQRVAGPVYRNHEPHIALGESCVFLGAILFLWLCIWFELFLQLKLRAPHEKLWGEYRAELFACICPPLRMAIRSPAKGNQLWLPRLGWRDVDRALQKDLERFFSVPMIVIALMILPVLLVEYFWADAVDPDDHLWLVLTLDGCTVVIWVAFATEFIVMMAVASDKLAYCKKHWLDLAIILLPLISFARAVRLIRLARLGRMSRLYRLRGLAMRAFRAILLLDVLQRIIGGSPQKRLKRLRSQLTEKEFELEDLRQEIAKLEALVNEKAGNEAGAEGEQNRLPVDRLPPGLLQSK